MLIVKAKLGEDGPGVTARGRDAWAALELKAANDSDPSTSRGRAGAATPISCARRPSLSKPMAKTAPERHGSPYAGPNGRYIPRSPIETIDREDGK
jgi:hypothetical protein